MTSPTGRSPAAPAQVLRIIRIALLTGVLLLGGVAYMQVSQNGPRQTDPSALRGFVYANIALLIVAAVALLVLQRRHEAERDPARRTTLNIIAWAVAEGAAMFGGVHWLMSGSPTPYLVGLAFMIASFVLVPIRE